MRYYIDTIASDPDGLRGSFGFYRAIGATTTQNEQRRSHRLTMPVLAIGGAESVAEGAANTMKLVADDVQGHVLPGAAHWVAEQAPRGAPGGADRVPGSIPRRRGRGARVMTPR